MTSLDPRQHAYLRAMGIQTWIPREVDASGQAGSSLESLRDSLQQESTQEQVEALSVKGNVSESPVTSSVPSPATDTVAAARGLDWQGLQARVRTCTACDLHRTRTQAVFGVGDQHAQWLIIGEAPGADEDRQGEPFVGRAGQLLNNMLLAIGLKREQVYIANILKCRPPNNRDPRPEEVAQCESYLLRQIQLLQPKIILAVGRIAAQNLLKTDLALARLRGKVHYLDETRTGGLRVPVVITYHPAYLLRSPKEKRKAWQDLQFAVKIQHEHV